MRFSGHETFTVRDGWLHKGLRLLIEEPDKFFDPLVADYLGVGSNMAKSIRHWMLATELAEIDKLHRGRIEATHFGELLFKYDPYFIETGTWWLLHINLISAEPPYATTWHWFFNSFNLERFNKAIVVESLRHFIQLKNVKIPSIRTLERDVSCMLSCYSRHVPAGTSDPEEARVSPFRELGLMSFLRTSGYYQLHQGYKQVDPNLIGYSISRAFKDAGKGDISVQRLVKEPGGPGRAFGLNSEALFETLVDISSTCDDIRIHGHAGQRAVSVPSRKSEDWASGFYSSIGGK